MEKTITVSRSVDRSIGAVTKVLEEDPGTIVHDATKVAAETANDIIHLEGKWAWFDLDESVEANVGSLQLGGSSARVPLAWKADRHKRLLPSLAGHLGFYPLSIKHTEISYTGTYAPPLGLFGGIEDYLVGHRVLEAVIGRFMDEIVDHLEGLIAAE